eukprot:2110319-Pyramimonas_sp.AAC.2
MFSAMIAHKSPVVRVVACRGAVVRRKSPSQKLPWAVVRSALRDDGEQDHAGTRSLHSVRAVCALSKQALLYLTPPGSILIARAPDRMRTCAVYYLWPGGAKRCSRPGGGGCEAVGESRLCLQVEGGVDRHGGGVRD